jgi:two-component system chemotaxis response regulator CheB
MMFSVAKSCAEGCVGVVLTGMGRDGTVGLKEIRAAGGVTFAQDAESCVVYGMPKSAVEAGVVDHQMRLETMAEAVNQLLIRQKGP